MTGPPQRPDPHHGGVGEAAADLVARLKAEQQRRRSAPDAPPPRRSLVRKVLAGIARFVLWLIVD